MKIKLKSTLYFDLCFVSKIIWSRNDHWNKTSTQTFHKITYNNYYSRLRNWVFGTNSNLLIPMYLHPYGVNLWFRLLDLADFIVWNAKGIKHWVAKILIYQKIGICGWDSIPFCRKTLNTANLKNSVISS